MKAQLRSGAGVAGVGLLLAACSSSLQVRSPDEYREDTRTLLQSNSGEFQSCYDRALESDPNAGGEVAVVFEVAEETGQVEAAKIAEGETTASSALQQCVVQAVGNLSLQPPDEKRGEGKMLFSFRGP